MNEMMENPEDGLKKLFTRHFKEPVVTMKRLQASGSSRSYYRMNSEHHRIIGVFHEEKRENEAFLSFSRSFLSAGLPVPGIMAEDKRNHCYLLTDLGDLTLFRFLSEARKGSSGLPLQVVILYKKVLDWLPVFQLEAGARIDYDKCYPRQVFDRQSMMWDLNYFKYCFLKLTGIPYAEQSLENDFNDLTSFLLQAPNDYFMYRDFQSRNIMIVDGTPYFIDYQGGRKGALQYDVASLLYDAKADIPPDLRRELLEYYLIQLDKHKQGKQEEFLHFFPGFILIRILQSLGTYGFRGYYERKSHFLQSVPYAMTNLDQLHTEWKRTGHLPELPTLWQILRESMNAAITQPFGYGASNLTVTINSFSYKSGIPDDKTGHGGGFVFDCRALPNPGHYDTFADLTGKDTPVIAFLEKEPAVSVFLNHVFSLVEQSVRKYIERGFTSLTVSFGCTGGKHRSVYAAENLARHLEANFPVNIHIIHHSL
jgi:aminoglycoside/choline kinase family phosphotransferase